MEEISRRPRYRAVLHHRPAGKTAAVAAGDGDKTLLELLFIGVDRIAAQLIKGILQFGARTNIRAAGMFRQLPAYR